VVFENIEDMTERMDDMNLDVTADDVLVLRNAGRRAPGMRRRATCRSRRNWRSRASKTWCAFPTRA